MKQQVMEAGVRLRRRLRNTELMNSVVFSLQNAGVALANAFSAPLGGRGDRRTAPAHNVAAMVRVKDEGRFILEWIAHHTLIGFDHFYVYDNGSTDDTKTLLRPLAEAGLVTYVAWPTAPITPAAERDFFARFARDNRWVAFIDCDEFIDVRGSRTLAEILDGHGAPALGMQWRMFGSSWRTSIPEGLVLRNFDHANAMLDRHVKVIARTDKVIALRNPHNFYYALGRLAATVEGERVRGSVSSPRDESEVELRHYVYRSSEDFIRKTSRSYSATKGHYLRLRTPGAETPYFLAHNDRRAPVDGASLMHREQLVRVLRGEEVERPRSQRGRALTSGRAGGHA